MGADFSDFRGLIPGTMSNMDALNPFSIFTALTSGTNPPCQDLTMQTTPNSRNNNQTSETHHVTQGDIKRMDPCIFPNKVNPITKQKCVEAFSTLKNTEGDWILTMYKIILAGLGLYIIMKLIEKNNKFYLFKK